MNSQNETPTNDNDTTCDDDDHNNRHQYTIDSSELRHDVESSVLDLQDFFLVAHSRTAEEKTLVTCVFFLTPPLKVCLTQ